MRFARESAAGAAGSAAAARRCAVRSSTVPAERRTLNYFLGRAPSGPISIDIQDAAGKVVRHYSSEATAAQANADEPAAASNDDEGPAVRRAAPPVRLTANTGMNRLFWDFNNAGGPWFRRARIA